MGIKNKHLQGFLKNNILEFFPDTDILKNIIFNKKEVIPNVNE